jgi:hypothetical protein
MLFSTWKYFTKKEEELEGRLFFLLQGMFHANKLQYSFPLLVEIDTVHIP